MKKILLIAPLLLCACVGTDVRDMNDGEATIVSKDVLAMVEEADGVLDIREKPRVRCKRIRLTGTHRVTRICYTSAEEQAQAEATQARYYQRFGQHNRSREGN